MAKKKQKAQKKKVKKTKQNKEVLADVTKDRDTEKIVYAHAKYVRSSAQKSGLVVDFVRGKKALDAVDELHFVNKKAALFVRKAIESAIANAVNNFEMDRKKLVIVEAIANEAPTFKRGRAGSRGRYKKILKRNSHITIGLKEQS